MAARMAGAAMTGAGLAALVWGVVLTRRAEQARMSHRRMVEVLLNALGAGDPITARHSRRVADLSYALAVAAGMPRAQRRTLRLAALLHDMGKIDDRFFDIVHSRRPLSEDDRARIEHHPHESAHILAPLEPMHPGIRAMVASHHECWSGGGYPAGIAGEDIPLGARIIAVADAFDAMTQERSYRGALSVDQAVAELRRGAGSQFDPRLVELLRSPRVIGRWTEVACRDLFSERDAERDPVGTGEGRGG
jgi:putative nucleotidyltransferase with HDIG domain